MTPDVVIGQSESGETYVSDGINLTSEAARNEPERHRLGTEATPRTLSLQCLENRAALE